MHDLFSDRPPETSLPPPQQRPPRVPPLSSMPPGMAYADGLRMGPGPYTASPSPYGSSSHPPLSPMTSSQSAMGSFAMPRTQSAPNNNAQFTDLLSSHNTSYGQMPMSPTHQPFIPQSPQQYGQSMQHMSGLSTPHAASLPDASMPGGARNSYGQTQNPYEQPQRQSSSTLPVHRTTEPRIASAWSEDGAMRQQHFSQRTNVRFSRRHSSKSDRLIPVLFGLQSSPVSFVTEDGTEVTEEYLRRTHEELERYKRERDRKKRVSCPVVAIVYRD